MARKFDYASPGVQLNEIDQSQIPTETQEDGILLVGRTLKGPAMKPVKVKDLDSFIEIFGAPQSGRPGNIDVWRDSNRYAATYAAYAAQAHLAAEISPVTFIRLLGENDPLSTTTDTQAGWTLDGSYSTDPASNVLAYGLFIMPSASATAGATGSLAAVIYCNDSSVTLRGTPAGGGVVTSSVGQLIQSQNSGETTTFKLDVWTSATEYKTHTFHFNPLNQEGFIRNVLNTNPQKINEINFSTTEKYFLGQTYEEAVREVISNAGSASVGKQYGILLPMISGTDNFYENIKQSTASKTGWIISRDPSPIGNTGYSSSTATKLFRIVSLHEGEWMQENYAIKIHDLKLGNSVVPDSSFSISVINSVGESIESFYNLNLNESSDNFILKKIGDESRVWNTTNKVFDIVGDYANKSNYIRIEMSDDWKAGLTDSYALPFGFYGPSKIKPFGLYSGSDEILTPASGTNNNAWVDGVDVIFGGNGDFTNLITDMTCSFTFPSLKVTSQNTKMGGDYDVTDVVGLRHVYSNTATSNKIIYQSSDYSEFLKPLPAGLDIHSTSDATEVSFIFTLDEMVTSSIGKWYWEEGSHAAGDSYTHASGTLQFLKDGPKQFNVPLFGGFDGLDITLVEPFSSQIQLEGQNNKSHYAYYSLDKAIEIAGDSELVKYDVVAIPGLTETSLQNKLIRKVEERGDALVIVDLNDDFKDTYENQGVREGGEITSVITTAQARQLNSSYAATYFPRIKLLDTVSSKNDVVIAPASVAGIGAIAYSEANSDGPWFAPAGFNRGGIGILGGSSGPRVVGTWKSLSKQNRDDLYLENINPIARFPAIGEIVIFGQKTLQQTASALDRINVRRLMIHLKKKIGRIADTILFDQNVQSTWNRFLSQADPILASVKARFGISDYKLILDSSTTTDDLIDRNIMYAKVFVKPAKAIEFIVIDFVVTRTGVEF